MDNFIELLGMAEEEVCAFFAGTKPQIKYRISYTDAPRSGEKEREKKVIRIKNENGVLNILVGYFDLPYYQL